MTDFQKFCLAFAVVVGIILAGGFGYKIGRRIGYGMGFSDGQQSIQKSDTLIIRDTLRIDRPVEVYRWAEKPVYLAVHDTSLVTAHDTLFVALNRETRGYSGEDYRCEVSGVQPSLDWIEVFPTTKYITNTIQDRRRWTFGITAGPGVLWDGKLHGGVGIVAGVQYRF